MADIMKELQELMKHSLKTTEEMKKDTIEMKKDTMELKKAQKETDRQMKNIQKELWWIWNSQEEVWIDLFRRNMKWILRKKGIMIDETSTRFKSKVRLDDGTFI